MKKQLSALVLVIMLAFSASVSSFADAYPSEEPETIIDETEPGGETSAEPEDSVLPVLDGTYQDTEISIANRIITSGMSDYEKLVAITKYAADHYSYSTNYYVSDLINNGSGSCVANTYFILDLCRITGIQAWYRSSRLDPGAGSQHVCAFVKIGDSYYTADSGYGGSAPRSFDVTERPLGLSVKDGVLYQYDATDKEHLVIPSVLPAARIVKRSSTYTQDPQTITRIGKSGEQCFSYGGSTGLRSITLPSTIEDVSGTAFKGCKDLENIYVDAGNPYFTSIDGVLYSKDLTRLVCVPAKKTAVTIPATVTKRDADAFYGGKIPVTVAPVSLPFRDVNNEWFADSVRFVYNRSLFMGTSSTTFSPNSYMTRGMFIAVLGRYAGNGRWSALENWSGTLGISNASQVAVRDKTSTTNSSVLTRIASSGELMKVLATVERGDDNAVWYKVEYGGVTGYVRQQSTSASGGALLCVYTGSFTDLSNGAYYTGYAQWANIFGVMYGVSSSSFKPNQNIRREDICVLLYRYMTGYLGRSLPTSGDAFSDDADISGYARNAVYAMQQIGVIHGYPDGTFRPGAYATRAEVATMFRSLDAYLNG